jgi:hypothetical protein
MRLLSPSSCHTSPSSSTANKRSKAHATEVRMCGIGTYPTENTAKVVEKQRAGEWLTVFFRAISPKDLLHFYLSFRNRLIDAEG